MSRFLLIDEIHISLRIPAKASPRAGQMIRRILRSRRFQDALQASVRAVVARFRDLHDVHVELSR